MVATPSRQLGELDAGGTLAGGWLRSERDGAVVPVAPGCAVMPPASLPAPRVVPLVVPEVLLLDWRAAAVVSRE